MSVRNGMIALLSERPMGVYELRKEFDARTGGTWPVNIGQVYATVHRLVRDGLLEPLPEEYDTGAGDVEYFRLTEAGYAAAEAWWSAPVDRGSPGRDELVIKLALAVSAPDVDVRGVVQTQRVESMRALRDFTRLKGRGPAPEEARGDELAWSLVLDHLTFAAEAEVRWLDHVEVVVERAAHSQRAAERAAERALSAAAAQGGAAADASDASATNRAGTGAAGGTGRRTGTRR